mmetsp:Transcript_21481/g.27314  ORF Transcript_21481/g.27314 Transcript_21481/m.27314 type:complete len:83 (-) Transcript_21481:153-401(-)
MFVLCGGRCVTHRNIIWVIVLCVYNETWYFIVFISLEKFACGIDYAVIRYKEIDVVSKSNFTFTATSSLASTCRCKAKEEIH